MGLQGMASQARQEWLKRVFNARADAGQLLQHREEWANYILPTLEAPLEVWLSPVKLKLSDKIVYRRRFITLFDDAGKTRATLAAAQENKDSSLLWTFFQGRNFKYLDRQRQGFLLYSKQAGR